MSTNPSSRLFAVAFFVAVVVSPQPANAEGRGVEPRTLEAVGRATVRAAPDTLRIVVAVETEAKTAAEAAKANARVSEQVVNALEQGISRDGEVSTSGYTLRARYEYRKPEQRQELVGYIATNSIAVTSRSLDRAGGLIDSAVAAGATSVASINFLLIERDAVERQAVLEAGRRARARVEAIAESLGVGVGRLLRATTEFGATPSPHPQLARGMMMAESADAGTPISAGDISVEMAVHVVFEVP